MDNENFWHSTAIEKFDFNDVLGQTALEVSDDSSSDISDLKWPLDDKLPIFGETTPKRSSDEIQSQKSASCSSSRYISSPTSYRSRSGSEIKLDYFETINRIILCEPCSLDHYRSRIEKLNLLKAADSSKDGNAIFRVILLLKKTLNQSIFLELLHESPTSVVNQYIAYLKHSENNDDLLPVLLSLNRKEEAVSLEYKNAFNQLESNSKLKALRFLRDKFVLDADLCWEQENISEHSALLERQMAVEVKHLLCRWKLLEIHQSIFQKVDVKNSQIPKAALLIDQPVQTTLYYCCLYHYDSNPNDISSPLSLKNFHKLSDKQYVLTALKTLSKQKRWLDIEKLFFNKSLFGSPKFRSCIDVERIAEILAKSGATPEVLSFYIRNEISNDKKFDLAKKYQCHQIVVDCYVAARNRIALIDYMAKNLRSGTPAYFYADSSLKNSDYKWKN